MGNKLYGKIKMNIMKVHPRKVIGTGVFNRPSGTTLFVQCFYFATINILAPELFCF